MKKLLIFLILLFLLIDLADDGYAYTVKLVAPQTSSSLIAAYQQAPNKNSKAFPVGGNIETTLPGGHLLNALTSFHFQLLPDEVPHYYKIIQCNYQCSSGGLPW